MLILNADSDAGAGSIAPSNSLVVVRGTYTNLTDVEHDNDVFTISGGTGSKLVFEDFGSLYSFGTGGGLHLQAGMEVIVNAGSTISSASGDALTIGTASQVVITNFGRIHSGGASPAINANVAGGQLVVVNHGEISGTYGYFAGFDDNTLQLTNFGLIDAAIVSGGDGEFVDNYGTIRGSVDLFEGSDRIFNSGTMRGFTAISCSGAGDKTIVNQGLIESTDYGNFGAVAIALLGGDDTLTNSGTIIGEVDLGEGGDRLNNSGTIVNDVHLGGGADTVVAFANGYFQGIVYCGGGADLFFGSDSYDEVHGDAGGDVLNGYGGDDFLEAGDDAEVDVLKGGTGSDTYVVGSADLITENIGDGFDVVVADLSYTLAPGVEVEAMESVGAASLTGNEFVQTISGSFSGNDTLSGGGNGDTLIGRGGDDTYALGAFFATVIDSAGAADTITSTVTRSLASFAGIERLTLLGGTAAINGTGNGLANIITGNEGANVLDGGLLGDALNGAGGNDVFLYASQAAFICDIVNGGTGALDRIRFTSVTPGQALVLSNQVTQVETAEIGTAAGATTGATTLNLNALAVASGMQLTGNNGINTIQGTNFADTITGNGGADTLFGNGGTDLIIGGTGRDTMTGGLLNDTFRFLSTADSPTLALADVITDFDRAGMGDDRIDVSALFGPALAYRGAGLFTAAGQLRINDIAGVDLLVEVNTGGTLAADFTIRLTNTTFASMAPTDFILL